MAHYGTPSMRLQGGLNERQKPPCRYEIDKDWRQLLGITDDDRERADRLYRSIEATLIAQGIRPGPESYSMFNDGDPAFVQAVWSLIRT